MVHVAVKKVHTLTGHTDSVYALEAGPDPHCFFSGGGDGMVVLWDLRNPEEGQLVARLPNSVYALHCLPGTDLLICGHNYEGIHVIDWKQKKETHSLKLTNSAIFDLKSHGQNLFVACGDGTVVVVDLGSWTVRERLVFSDKSARTLAIHPVTGELAAGYSDQVIRVFGLDDLGLKKEWMAHMNSIFTLCFSPGGKTLLSGSRDARLKAWDVLSGYRLAGEVVAHLYAINNIAFSPDGKHFVTCSLDKSIKVWDAGDLRLLKVIDKSRHAVHGTSVNKLSWSAFEQQVISASDDRTISVWDIAFTQV